MYNIHQCQNASENHILALCFYNPQQHGSCDRMNTGLLIKHKQKLILFTFCLCILQRSFDLDVTHNHAGNPCSLSLSLSFSLSLSPMCCPQTTGIGQHDGSYIIFRGFDASGTNTDNLKDIRAPTRLLFI